MAPQLTQMKGPSRRGLSAWMALASTSLPVPVSPVMSTEKSVCAMRVPVRFSSSSLGSLPMRCSKPPLPEVLLEYSSL